MIEQTTRMGTMSEHRTTRMYDDEDHDEPVATSGLRTTRAAHMSESGEVQTTEEEPVTSENRFEFQYDARGNWTERVGLYRRAATEEFQRSHIERRTITYYD
jgi:hypothetical protein